MKNTEKQAKYWRYAAWTLPFVALAILIGEILLGFDTAPTSFIIVVTFIATSVFWWWWAISKIVYMIKCSHRIEGNFEELKDELKEIKRDVGDRQWREPIDS
jgi:hypothetical protein